MDSSAIDTGKILDAVTRLAIESGQSISRETLGTLTAAETYLPGLLKTLETQRAELEAEASAINANLAAAVERCDRGRAQLSAVEHAHNGLKAESRQANAKRLASLNQQLDQARQERSRCQRAFFPRENWEQARAAGSSGQEVDRWEELETKVIPGLEQDIAAIVNATF